jgi:hypothetical protein
MSDVDLQGGTTDINSWMLQRIEADKARSFKIERVHPAYQDSMSAIGFLEDIQNPIDERYIQQRWGGGTYTVTAQVPGKGRAGKKNLGTLQIDLPGPPLTYPGPDGKPVPFPSAVNAFKVIAEREQAQAAEEEDEDEDDIEEEEDDRDERDDRRYGSSRHNDRRPMPPPRRRHEEDDDYPYRHRHNDDDSMYRRPAYDHTQFNGYGNQYNPAQRLREISNQRQADNASSEALKLVQTTVSSVQDSASRQLDAAREEVTALRESLFKLQGQQNRPYEETLSALRAQSEQQRSSFESQMTALRANFESQTNALRASYEQQIALMRQNTEHANRLMADRHAEEMKVTQAQIEGVRRDSDRRVEEVKGLMAAQYQSRIDVLTSERDQERRRVEDERRRADDAYTRASGDVERRISEERKSAGDREAIVRQVMEGREQMQVGLLKSDLDRARDEAAALRKQMDDLRSGLERQLDDARKAADPRSSLAQVAGMIETMKSLGLAAPSAAGGEVEKEPEEKIPEDFMGKVAAYGPKIMQAVEPVLRRADSVREATARVAEAQAQARMAELAMARPQLRPLVDPRIQAQAQMQAQAQAQAQAQMQAQAQAQAQAQMQAQRQAAAVRPPQVAVQPVAQPVAQPAAQPEEEPQAEQEGEQQSPSQMFNQLLDKLQTGYSFGMTPEQVAAMVNESLEAGSFDGSLIDALLERPADQVANELSEAAGELGFDELATPKATKWLVELHKELSKD